MKALCYGALLLTVCFLAPGQEPEDDYKSLFNGKDLNGWDGEAKFWSVRDGAITGETTPQNTTSGTYLICSQCTPADFTLKLQFRLFSGNSGIQYRSKDLGNHQVSGYQADMDAANQYTGILYEVNGRAIVATRGQKIAIAPDGNKEINTSLGSQEELAKVIKAGEWNEYVVSAQGNHLIHQINGRTMVDIIDEQRNAGAASGIFAFQLHPGPPMKVQFKDIRIKIHKDGPAVPPTMENRKGAAIPEWIWPAPATDGQAAYFRREFTTTQDTPRAVLTACCDNEMTVYVNGREIAWSDNWRKPIALDVTAHVKRGGNCIAVAGKNIDGPAGFCAKLTLYSALGEAAHEIVTNSTWMASAHETENWLAADLKAEGWTTAMSLGVLGEPHSPWGNPFGGVDPVAPLSVPENFKAELLATSAGNGSWYSMAFDSQQRILVGGNKGIFRVTLPQDNTAAKFEKLNGDLDRCEGMLCAHNSLYIQSHMTRGNFTGLFRLRDTQGNGQYDEVKLLFRYPGGGDHGPHGMVLGPDNKIYAMNGNMSGLPVGMQPVRKWHTNYQEDLLLPRMWDARGHAVNVYAPGGYVMRFDPDGSNLEFLVAGFRNPYDLAFNREGEMFTFDADMEWDTGLPWYRPTRVNHVVPGGEYGWRSGSGKWPAYYFDSLPGTLDIGMACPTGLRFGYDSNFPAPYREALFMGDWTNGKIIAVHLTPRDSTYSATSEVFVSHKPLPVTDIEFGKDGAMYFVTERELYRVSYVGPAMSGQKDVAVTTADKKAAELRALRRKLGNYLGTQDLDALEAAWPLLDHPDRWLRYTARVVVEHQNVSAWQARALSETRTDASMNALLALARCGAKEIQPKILEKLNEMPWDNLGGDLKLALLRLYEVTFTRMGKPGSDHSARVIRRLDALFPAAGEFQNRELCQILIYLEAPNAIHKTLDLLANAPTQQEQIHYWFALRNVKNGWSLGQRKVWFEWFNLSRTLSGGLSFHGFLENAKKEAISLLSDAEKAALAPVLNAPRVSAGVTPAVAKPRKSVKEWEISDLKPLLNQVGAGRSFENGRSAYKVANCVLCHKLGGEGGAVGPDLTAVGNRFGPAEILESILQPSKVILDAFRTTDFILKNGNVVSGRIASEDAERVIVLPSPLSTETKEISIKELKARRQSRLSMMPEGLVNVLTQDEILDLIAFLRASGNPGDPTFKK